MFHEHMMDFIFTPRRVVAVKISGQDNPGRFVCHLCDILNSGLNLIHCGLDGPFVLALVKFYWWNIY
jgi:hypothetical protein